MHKSTDNKKNKGNILLNSTNQEDICVKITLSQRKSFAQARHILVHHERLLFFHADFVFDLTAGLNRKDLNIYPVYLSAQITKLSTYRARRVSVLEYNNPNGNFLLVRGLVLNKRVRVLFYTTFFYTTFV